MSSSEDAVIKTLVHRVRGRLDSTYRAAEWKLFGKAQYLAQPSLLRAPHTENGDRRLERACQGLYADGYSVLDGVAYIEGITPALHALRRDFEESIAILEDPASRGRKIRRIDAQGRQWTIGTESGFIRLMYENREHSAFAQVFGDAYVQSQEAKRVATVQALFAAHPFIRRVAQDSVLTQLAAYTNDGDAKPMLIQVERKTFTESEGYSMKIHIDQLNGTFKAYLYLTDVLDPGAGPLELSSGSHHWKIYPSLLDEIMRQRKTRFTEKDLQRYGVNPLRPVFGPSGSLFAFTSNTLHRATNVAPGRERWSIHFYYYATQPWSTDRE